jgi:hypothetical protein
MRWVAAGLVAVGMLTAAQAQAVPLIVDFNFVNGANGGGIVTGIVLGLVDDKADQKATSVTVLSNSHPGGAFGIGEYVGVPLWNEWSVFGGVVTAVTFGSYGIYNSAPAVMDASLLLDFDISGGIDDWAGLTAFASVNNSSSSSELEFGTAPVPVPPGAPLLASGLMAFLWVRHRRGAAVA